MTITGSRYFLFGYDRHYPSGGMDDYCGAFDSPEDAAVYIRGSYRHDYWHLAVVTEQGHLLQTPHWWAGELSGWQTDERREEV